MGFMYRLFASVLLSVLLTISALAGIENREGQLAELNAILLEFETHYGMIKFKEENFGVSYAEIRQRYSAIIAERTMNPDEFRQLMVALGAEFQDGHLNVLRNSSHLWTLGLKAAEIEGRLFVTGFHNDFYVPSTNPGVHPGDEIVAINGRPIQQVALENLPYQSLATYATRYSDALEQTVNHSHRRLSPVADRAPVRVTFSRPGAGANGQPLTFSGVYHWVNAKKLQDVRTFFSPSDRSRGTPEEPYVFGTYDRRSYFAAGLSAFGLPDGVVVPMGRMLNLRIEEALVKKTQNQPLTPQEAALTTLKPVSRLSAYTVRYKNKNIAVIRIPDYSPESFGDVLNEIQWLSELMVSFEATTDSMIIDQLTNGGGYVYQVTQLARLFASTEMKGVKIDMRLTESLLATLDSWAERTPPEPASSSTPQVDGASDSLNGRNNFARMYLSKEFIQSLRDRLARGEHWSGAVPYMDTAPTYGTGEYGRIVGREGRTYSKPVLLLNDSRSASGGDFFPALMQANGRAVVFGETSMGLGGPVFRQWQTPGGEMFARCTFGYCERPDGLPIENLGVVPDVARWVTRADLLDGFKTYTKDALEAAAQLSEGQTVQMIRADLEKRRPAKHPTKPSFQQLHTLLVGFEDVARSDRTAAQQINEYRALFDLMRTVKVTDLSRDEWNLLKFAMPKALTDSDVFLASLRRKDEVMDRLAVMTRLPRFTADSDKLALIQMIQQELGHFGDIQFGGCRDWLVPANQNLSSAITGK